MKRQHSIWLFIMLCLWSWSCEDPIDIEIPDGPERVVVDGWVTNLPGPYQIKLSLTNNFNDSSPNPPLTNAKVSVTGSKGRVFNFSEEQEGLYISSGDWQGEIGVSYTCFIELNDGRRIVSSPEELYEVPPLDSLYYREVFPANIIEGIIQEEYFLGSIINDPADTDNFYRWRISQNSTPLRDVESIVIFSDRFVNGNAFQLEVPEILFGRSDTIIVSQESLSERAFDYYDLLIAQATTLGQSSGTAPAILRGNLTIEGNPELIVLGYFGVSAVKSDTLIITPEN